jgi:hypothetical protein
VQKSTCCCDRPGADAEEEPIHGRADYRDIEAARGWVTTLELCRERGVSDWIENISNAKSVCFSNAGNVVDFVAVKTSPMKADPHKTTSFTDFKRVV